MRIKKLELFGFKSFKDRTVIQFDEGITGVVGPNGCGKSNIVDALVWVMGEMSAKHMRGSSMEDVIFAGAEGYAPMGMAEVSLTLENDGGPFPAQYARFSEVQVTRRLHRNGESEYLINKEPARLRDIQEIFMDTGAGAKGFSIIEQGAIGKIITAKPEDRRMLIEEAAGITKFKVRKRESQRKIEATDQNLVRLQDIIGEQKRQIESLERQAQRAERYRKIKQELQEKDLWLAAHQFRILRQESQSLEAGLAQSREAEALAQAHVTEYDADLAAKRLELAEKEASVQTAQIGYRERLQKTQETEFRIRELNFAIEQARKSNEMMGSMLAQYQLRQGNLDNERTTLIERLTESREEFVRLEADYQAKDAIQSEIMARIQSADQELTEARREMLAVQASLSHLNAREGVLANRLEEESQKLAETEVRGGELLSKKEEFTDRRNRVFKDLEVERQMQLDHTRDLDLIGGNLQEVRHQIGERRSENDRLKDELNQVASRLYGLENLQSNFEGFEDGVRSVLMWQRSRTNGSRVSEAGAVFGASDSAAEFRPLADVVEVPAKYELAMEASLGTRLQLLLSESSDHSLHAVDYLKAQKRGRSSFLNVSDAQTDSAMHEMAFEADANIKAEPGVQALLHEVVSIPENYRTQQVASFFTDVVVVDSIRTALRLRSTYPSRSFVTMEGDILTPDGVLTGGASESADSGVLKRRREIKELSLKREELSGKFQLAQLSLRKIEEQEAGLQEALEAAKKTAVEKEIKIAELKKDLERAEHELSNAQNAWERENRETVRLQDEKIKLEKTLFDVRSELESLKEKLRANEARCAALTEELTNIRAGSDERGREVTELKVRAATRRQEVESLEREHARLEASLQELAGNIARMSEETATNSFTLSSSQIEVEQLQTELQRWVHQSKEAELTVSRARDEYENLAAGTRKLEEAVSQNHQELFAIRSRLNDMQLKMGESRMQEARLIEQIQERYQLDLDSVAQGDMTGGVTDTEATAAKEQQYARDVEDLREKVKRIGEVNLAAIQEYDEVKTRFEFLSQQHTDLLEAKDNLRKVIERINRICSRRFKDTFEQVNDRFQKVFPVLFGGGEAQLILVESPEADEVGIDIVARPPGKKQQNVSLLSGGEKALTAVSLIFSIFLVRPSPFCLLDEVDAPLDDANVFRFNDLVKEMAKRSQIIVVTHNKHTMRVNNRLYGVTMQEKGVSKMVSVSLDDAQKLAQT